VRLIPSLVMSDLSFVIGFTIRLARPIDAPDDVVATLPFFKVPRRAGLPRLQCLPRPSWRPRAGIPYQQALMIERSDADDPRSWRPTATPRCRCVSAR